MYIEKTYGKHGIILTLRRKGEMKIVCIVKQQKSTLIIATELNIQLFKKKKHLDCVYL